MKIQEGVAGDEPIVIDVDSLLIGPDATRGDINHYFASGRLSSGSNLQDAVALNYGIDTAGRFDMDMLRAARDAEQ